MFCRSSIPVGSENIILLYAIAILIASTQCSFGIDVAAFSSLLEPLKCLLLICDSKPEILLIGDTYPKLRFGDTVLGCAPHTALALHFFAIGVHEADEVLCGCVVELCGFFIPVKGFLCIFREESIRIINPAQPILRFGISGL